MDIQKMVDNAIEAGRAEEMKTSEQLMLGELILKLEAVKNKELPIVFDRDNFKPTGLASWRGSYRELAIQYEDGGSNCYEQAKPDCKMDNAPFERDHAYDCPCGGSKGFNTSLSENTTADDFLNVLKLALGKYFVGYKGGDFTMGKNTPIWVANYGGSSGFEYKSKDEEFYNTAVVDITEEKDKVIINTKGMNY